MTRSAHRQRVSWRSNVLTAVGLLSLGLVLSFTILACQQFLFVPKQQQQQVSAYEPRVKVRLERAVTHAALEGKGFVRLTPAGGGQVTLLALPVQLRLADDAVMLEGVDGTVRRVEVRAFEKVVCTIEPNPSAPVVLGTFRSVWPLDVVVLVRKGKPAMDIIERLPLESYLPGVLTQELYPSWSLVTYKAQAIAARSYALHEMQRRKRNGSHFHVERTTQDQAYQGQTKHVVAQQAVRDTRGVVVTFQDRLLRAYYSSTCGGRAGSARDTWPTTVGFSYNLDAPLQARERRCPCEFSPRYRWTRPRDAREYAARLAAYGKANGLRIGALKRINKIEVTRWNASGRPASYAITDARDRVYTLSSESLRVASNFNRDASLSTIIQKTRVLSGDVDIQLDGSTIRVVGRGFGHGVGLCQFGAEGLSRQGYSPTQILQHYYPGVGIERAY